VFFFSYSTWLGSNCLYLEDLYITPEQRGGGAGKTLLRHLAKIACANDCGRFEWSVLEWNTPAIDFYKSLGAQPQEEWVRYRMDGSVLRDFAAGN
jgi:ribosomal protein S18 acetylase RimI-like enzyme